MHDDEQKWVDKAIQTYWASTVDANINEGKKQVAFEKPSFADEITALGEAERINSFRDCDTKSP